MLISDIKPSSHWQKKRVAPGRDACVTSQTCPGQEERHSSKSHVIIICVPREPVQEISTTGQTQVDTGIMYNEGTMKNLPRHTPSISEPIHFNPRVNTTLQQCPNNA